MNKLLKEAEKYTIYVTIFLLPLVFLPSFFNPFLTTKITVLVLGVSIALILRLLRVGVSGTFEFNQGTFDFPIFFLIVAYVLSGWFASPNKPEAFFLPGSATIIIASGILYFLVNQMADDEKDKTIYAVIGSAFVVSIIYLLSLVGLFSSMQQLPSFMRVKNFTPQGALLPTSIFLLASLPYSIGLILRFKDYLYKVILGSATAIIAIVLVITSFNMITDRANFRVASLNSSLAVTFDSLKSSALLGVGPSNYVTAYTRFRPLSSNSAEDWASRYSHARNFYLTSITETGLLGTFAFILLIVVLARVVNTEIKSRENKRVPVLDFKTVSIVLLFIVLAVFPATSPELVVLMFVGLALVSKAKKFRLGVSALAQQVHLGDSKTSRVPAVVAVTPIIVGIILLLIVGTRALAAEKSYKSALDHLAANEGTLAYQTLQQAINISPSVDRYHATYSQINFLLAEAIARKDEVTDNDRNTITTLIQQAIREAKTTVALNPQRAGNWEILGNTYRNIMTLSKGADSFAIQSYSQAVVLDPINPNLRIELGGVWYAVKNYENAIDTFKLAVIAKPDHANARYNLAAAYRENNQIDRAIAELKVVLTLVDPNSEDYKTAQKELDDLQSKQKTTDTTQSGENLTPPASNEQILTPPIDLPEGSEPDITPTPSASASPTASPSESPSASPTPTATP